MIICDDLHLIGQTLLDQIEITTLNRRSQKHHLMIRRSSITLMKKALLFGFITSMNNRAGINEPNQAPNMIKLRSRI